MRALARLALAVFRQYQLTTGPTDDRATACDDKTATGVAGE